VVARSGILLVRLYAAEPLGWGWGRGGSTPLALPLPPLPRPPPPPHPQSVPPCIGCQLWVAAGALPADQHPAPLVGQQVVPGCRQEGHWRATGAASCCCCCRGGDGGYGGAKGACEVCGDGHTGGIAELGVSAEPVQEPAVGIIPAVNLGLDHHVALAVPETTGRRGRRGGQQQHRPEEGMQDRPGTGLECNALWLWLL